MQHFDSCVACLLASASRVDTLFSSISDLGCSNCPMKAKEVGTMKHKLEPPPKKVSMTVV